VIRIKWTVEFGIEVNIHAFDLTNMKICYYRRNIRKIGLIYLKGGVRMSSYVALLRGINVGGNRKVKMEVLRGIFEALEYRNVKTYIQTGNVLFETEEVETNILTSTIENRLKIELGFEVIVIIRTLEDIKAIIGKCPYDASEYENVYISFFSGEPRAELKESIKEFTSDSGELRVINREAYILCHKKYHEVLFSNNFLEKKLEIFATTRNWNTVNKLLAMS
jgi:uncharacterized protein (DUF1697 family)